MAYTGLLMSEFNESLGLGCEVLLDDNCTADLNNNKSVDQVYYFCFNYILIYIQSTNEKK